MEVEQTINITEIEVTDSGILNCSVVIDGVEYTSEPYDLQLSGITCTIIISYKTSFKQYSCLCSICIVRIWETRKRVTFLTHKEKFNHGVALKGYVFSTDFLV